MGSRFTYDKKLEALRHAKVDMPKDLALSGELYFQKNFDKQQWSGSKWEPRKKETKASRGHNILVNTGRLRQAMQNTILFADWHLIKWGVDKNVTYAGYLNYGTSKMPARTFMGVDNGLKGMLRRRITISWNKIFEAK